jgi:hypothetical protein
MLRVIKRTLTTLVALILLGSGVWHWLVAEYFGRVNVDTWAQEHPLPPPPRVELGRERVELVGSERIVPSTGLPADIELKTSNNNLDVVRHHDGRVYLAWRTAPSHFAGSETVIQVVSSTDEQHWRFEGRFTTGADLREPRFLAVGERLFLYVARLGSDPFDFEPQGLSVSELRDTGGFGPLEAVFEPGYIAWRGKELDGRPTLIVYGGGENLYSYSGHARPMSVELLTTSDGRHFEAAFPGHRVVERGGGTETDALLLGDGSVLAVMRNEAGDETGFGSKICRAPANDRGQWTCRTDPWKYDSPALFAHAGEAYLLARRTLTADGRYDVTRRGPQLYRAAMNELSYITTAKHCALFRYDARENRFGFVMDMPSRGDACFPSVLAGRDPSEVVVYDYSSDIDGPELPWAAGQRRDTYIYRYVLKFSER